MRAFDRRVRRLERLQFEPARQPMRVVISGVGIPLNLENSTCTRTLAANGLLTEIVQLDGTRAGLSDQELENFVAKFPIESG
jgi:hypothetical protein